MPISRRALADFLGRRLDSFTWLKDVRRDVLLRKLQNGGMLWKTDAWTHQLVCEWIGLCEPRFLFLLDMGLGKSKVVADLATHAYRTRDMRRGEHVLACVPRVINMASWEGDLAKHSDLEPWSVDIENMAEKRERLLDPRGEVTLVDYAGLHLACCDFVKTPRMKKGRYEINEDVVSAIAEAHPFVNFDEVHMLSNPDSLWFAIARRLAKRARRVYGTTGTLFGHRVEDLWAQFYLVDGGETFGPNIELFRHAFFESENDPWKGVTWKFVKRMDGRLHRMLQHRSIRYHEDEVPEIELPPRVPVLRKQDMGHEQREHYMRALEGLINADGSLRELDGAWTRMRQIVSGYLAWKDENGDHVLPFKHNPKLDDMEDLIASCGDSKVVVVHYYVETGKLICERLRKMGVDHVWLYGGTKDPREVRRRFLQDDDCRVLVMNSVAGGTGNDGLQDVARYEILYETPTSPTERQQVIKRVHRSGAKRRVFIYDLVMRRSLDAGILEDIAAGADTYERVVNGSSQGANFFLR